MTLTTMTLSTVPVLADDDKFNTDWLKGGNKDGGIFSELLDKFKSIGKDGKDVLTLIMWIGIMVIVIVIILYSISNYSEKKYKYKKWIKRILIGICIISLVMALIGIV